MRFKRLNRNNNNNKCDTVQTKQSIDRKREENVVEKECEIDDIKNKKKKNTPE